MKADEKRMYRIEVYSPSPVVGASSSSGSNEGSSIANTLVSSQMLTKDILLLINSFRELSVNGISTESDNNSFLDIIDPISQHMLTYG